MSDKPNIVLIYADDLGYGDVQCYDPRCRIPTPNIDALAARGVRFTNAHAPDTICSPSRYGILTGRYSWRTELKGGNPAPGAQPWIEADRITIASMLRDAGYNTAAFGKWGLGSDWAAAAKPGREGLDISPEAIDYGRPIHSGRCVGFTHDEVHLWYGYDHYTTTYPCNREPGAAETRDGGRWYFKNGYSLGGEPDFPAFDMEEAQMHYIERTVGYIDACGGAKPEDDYNADPEKPFFIYYCPHIPHWPHVPAPQFQGKTPMGYYGDFICELDWAVGRIVEALERNGMLENTLVIFTSDNGPERQCYEYIDEYGHFSMGEWRGIKRDLWEGGHRVPFLLSWPGTAGAGTVCDRMVSQTDILGTVADSLGIDLPGDGAEDSFSFLDEFVDGHAVPKRRDLAVYHSCHNKMAIRRGDWVYVHSATGDNEAGRDDLARMQEPEWFRRMRGVREHGESWELFDLATDPQELVNLAAERPEKVEELKTLLARVMDAGRTAPERG
jgi:arylsulfatase A-like enzyme